MALTSLLTTYLSNKISKVDKSAITHQKMFSVVMDGLFRFFEPKKQRKGPNPDFYTPSLNFVPFLTISVHLSFSQVPTHYSIEFL